jgi:hypothetical protein
MNLTMLERLKCALAAKGIIVYRHGSQERSERLRSINAIKSERELLLSHVEAEQLINAIRATAQIPGEIAEVGVFRGASARLLRQYADPRKILHLCDTFEGLPDPNPEHDADVWGDICYERTRYFRNLAFRDINTLKACPYQRYYNPVRPYVREWFSASEGADCRSFVKTVSESRQGPPRSVHHVHAFRQRFRQRWKALTPSSAAS